MAEGAVYKDLPGGFIEQGKIEIQVNRFCLVRRR